MQVHMRVHYGVCGLRQAGGGGVCGCHTGCQPGMQGGVEVQEVRRIAEDVLEHSNTHSTAALLQRCSQPSDCLEVKIEQVNRGMNTLTTKERNN